MQLCLQNRPHGAIVLLPNIFTSITFMMSFGALSMIGSFSHYTWVDPEPDVKETAGRVGAFVATIIGFFIMIALWTMSCCTFPKWTILLFSLMLFLCAIFQILPLLLLISDYCKNGCAIGPGGIYVIVVAIFWLVNSVIVASMLIKKKRNRLTGVSGIVSPSSVHLVTETPVVVLTPDARSYKNVPGIASDRTV